MPCLASHAILSWCHASQEVVLKQFEEHVDGIVNFEVTMDALNKELNRGFGFATFRDVETCHAAHAKYFKDKLKILVSFAPICIYPVTFTGGHTRTIAGP